MQASAFEKAKSSQNTYYHQVEEISTSIIDYLEHLGLRKWFSSITNRSATILI
jgi:hypothetical protein